MFYHNINPVAFQIGSLQIRWYGIMYILIFLITYFILIYFSKQRKLKLSKDEIESFLIYVFFGFLIGARLFHVLTEISFYIKYPYEIFAIWHGGLSSFGAIIGILLAVYLFCRKRKIDIFNISDLGVIPAALAIFFVRVGNFINGELYGRISSLPWCVVFKAAEGCRHPYQLYEAFAGILLFIALWRFKDRKLRKGMLTFIFFFSYGIIRFFLEFFRQPDPPIMLWIFTLNQLLYFILIIVTIIFYFKIIRIKYHKRKS